MCAPERHTWAFFRTESGREFILDLTAALWVEVCFVFSVKNSMSRFSCRVAVHMSTVETPRNHQHLDNPE